MSEILLRRLTATPAQLRIAAPTPRQLRLVRLYLNGQAPSLRQAAIQAGFPEHSASKAARDPKVRSLIMEALREEGITIQVLARKIKTLMGARKMIYNPGAVDLEEVEDNETQRTVLKMALELYNAFPAAQQTEGFHGPGMSIHISNRIVQAPATHIPVVESTATVIEANG